MATYAAFKHVELYNVGKAKKRVLKPPGGGSSDIFGANVPLTPRSVRNHMASNIFAAPDSGKNGGETGRRNLQSNDSHNRLFGEVERPYTPAKNNLKSNVPIGGGSSTVDSSSSSLSSSSSSASTTTNGKMNGHLNGNHHAVHLNGDSMVNGNKNDINNIDSSPRSINSSPRMNNFDNTTPKQLNLSFSNNNINNNINNNNNNNMHDYNNHLDNISPLTNNTDVSIASMSSVSSSFSNDHNNMNFPSIKSPRLTPRNPVTGLGINDDQTRRPRKMGLNRDGNPVTGEGYKQSAAEINTTVPCLNGSKPVINKNRVPPGGFSSGLW